MTLIDRVTGHHCSSCVHSSDCFWYAAYGYMEHLKKHMMLILHKRNIVNNSFPRQGFGFFKQSTHQIRMNSGVNSMWCMLLCVFHFTFLLMHGLICYTSIFYYYWFKFCSMETVHSPTVDGIDEMNDKVCVQLCSKFSCLIKKKWPMACTYAENKL